MSDSKISALGAAAALTGLEIVPIVQSGNTVRTTVADIGREVSLWTVVSAAVTAASGDKLLCNTNTAAFTVTLPASPVTGATVDIADAAGTFAVRNITVARAGSTIMGLAEDMTVAVNNASFTLVYSGTTWRLV